MVVSRKYI